MDLAITSMEACAAQEIPPQVVIVGGGFGGLSAAKELAGKELCVTLIDRANHHLFQPLLYQVATAGLSPADIAHPYQRRQVQIISPFRQRLDGDDRSQQGNRGSQIYSLRRVQLVILS